LPIRSNRRVASAASVFLLGWRHSGFSAHNEVRAPAEDAEGRKKLAGYMLRAPMSLEKMIYRAPIWHHCSVALAQYAGDGRIDFPIFPDGKLTVAQQGREDAQRPEARLQHPIAGVTA
jgi:hypothetical protein